ncbi:hypothetical protein E4U30_002143 [Claviceps sp. LM220 group G6]|nr:hypothetical protein E4U30_002143 [Claviceps sp. LM220 group G6]
MDIPYPDSHLDGLSYHTEFEENGTTVHDEAESHHRGPSAAEEYAQNLLNNRDHFSKIACESQRVIFTALSAGMR